MSSCPMAQFSLILSPFPQRTTFQLQILMETGDVDIMIIPPNSDSCLYFERRGDGSLEQLFSSDNPFNGMCQGTSDFPMQGNGLHASLGDWDGDGEKDLVVMDAFKVTLWTSRPMESFVEVIEKESPFGKFRFSKASRVSLVDVNDDGGRLDVVVPPQSYLLGIMRGYATYGYFKSGASGLLVEQLGEANRRQHNK